MADWFYESSQGGERLGPVSEEAIGTLVEKGAIEATTLVWHRDFDTWHKVSATDLKRYLPAGPPPLPLQATSHWAVYALATSPLWIIAVQLFASGIAYAATGASSLNVYFSPSWWIVAIALNFALACADLANMAFSGVKVRRGLMWASLVVPAYLFIRCKALRRVHETTHLRTFAILYVYAGSFLLGVLTNLAIYIAIAGE